MKKPKFLYCLIIFPILLGLFFNNPIIAQTSRDDILGVWMTENNEAKVNIYKEHEKYFGKIIWSSKKEENHINVIVLKNFEYQNNKWVGTIYEPRHQHDAKGEIKKINIDKIEITGYAFFSILSSSEYWIRSK
jgi:uncharacterized protein (DUF2147 family)